MTDKEKLAMACRRLTQCWELLKSLNLYSEADAIKKIGFELLQIEMVTEKTLTGRNHFWKMTIPYNFRPECNFRFNPSEDWQKKDVVAGSVIERVA
jgi:hypothetical protein